MLEFSWFPFEGLSIYELPGAFLMFNCVKW
jgi:hypothetical protein